MPPIDHSDGETMEPTTGNEVLAGEIDDRMYTRPYSEVPSTASAAAIRRRTVHDEKMKQRKANTTSSYSKLYPEWHSYCTWTGEETHDGVPMSPSKVAHGTLVTVDRAEAFIVDFLVKRNKRNGESGRLAISAVESMVSALIDLRSQQIADDLEEVNFGKVNEQKGSDIKTPNVVAAIQNVRRRTEAEDNSADRTKAIWKKKGYTMKEYHEMLNWGFNGGPGKYTQFNSFKSVLVRAFMTLQHNGVLRGASTREIQMGDFFYDVAPDSESAMAGDQVKVRRALLPLLAPVSHTYRQCMRMLLLPFRRYL